MMAVFVDNMRASFGRMVMCHMGADTDAELDVMARRLGLKPKWRQPAKLWRRAHFDVSLSKRAEAVNLGALELTMVDFVVRIRIEKGEG